MHVKKSGKSMGFQIISHMVIHKNFYNVQGFSECIMETHTCTCIYNLVWTLWTPEDACTKYIKALIKIFFK